MGELVFKAKLPLFLRDVFLPPKRTVKKGAQTPAERQAKKKQGAAEERGGARQRQNQEEEVDWRIARMK